MEMVRETAQAALAEFPDIQTIESDPDLRRVMMTMMNRELLVDAVQAESWTEDHLRHWAIARDVQNALIPLIDRFGDKYLQEFLCIQECQQEVDQCFELCFADPTFCTPAHVRLCNQIMTD